MDPGSESRFEQNKKVWEARSLDKTPELYRPTPSPPCQASASYSSYFKEARTAIPFVPRREIWKILADILVTARNLEALNESRKERDERLVAELVSLTSDLEAIEAKLTPGATRLDDGCDIADTKPSTLFLERRQLLQYLWNITLNTIRWNDSSETSRCSNRNEHDGYTGIEAGPSTVTLEPKPGTSSTQPTDTSSKGMPHLIKRSRTSSPTSDRPDTPTSDRPDTPISDRPDTPLPLLKHLVLRIGSVVFCLALLMPMGQWMYQWFVTDGNRIETTHCEIWTGNHVLWEHHSLDSCFTGRVKNREGPS